MHYDILKTNTQSHTLDVQGNVLASLRHNDIQRSGTRIFKDGHIYSAAFVGESNDDALIDLALQNSEGRVPYHYGNAEGAEVVEILHHANSNCVDDFHAQFLQGVDGLKATFPDLVFSGKATQSRVLKTLRTREKFEQSVSYDEFTWYLTYKNRGSASIIDGYLGDTSIQDFDIRGQLEYYAPFLHGFQRQATLTAGRYPVLFAEQGQLLGKLAESFKIDNYHTGIGQFAGKLGQTITSNKFSLSDITLAPQSNAVAPFDEEGTVRSQPQLTLIDAGVMTAVISDLRTGHQYAVPSTGNGRRNTERAPSLGFNKLMVSGGTRDCKSILKDLPQCIVVEMAAGGDFVDNGDYATPVQNAFLLEHGEVVGKLPQLTVKSSLKAMFGDDLIAVAEDRFSGHDDTPTLVFEMDVLLNSEC